MQEYKIKLKIPDYKDILRYGEIIEDYEFSNQEECVRVRKIRYMDMLYYLKMVNGEVKTLIQWDTLPYCEDIKDIYGLDDKELSRLLMLSDRDRGWNKKAEKVYWLCINEINRRSDEKDV